MKGFAMTYYNSERFLSRVADRFGRAALVAVGVLAVAASATLPANAADWTDATDPTITYTALKALKGNGSGYIFTDITPVYTNIVKTRFKPAAVTSASSGALFCARDSSAGNQFTCYRNSAKIRLDRYNQQRNCSDSVSTVETKLVADFGRNAVWLNDTKQTLMTTSSSSPSAADWATTEYTVGSALAIFAMHKNLSSLGSYGRDYLYYFELYDADTNLTHCLLPAQRNDDKYGLFDTKTGTFYPQTAGTDFVAADQIARTVTGSGKKWIGRGADNKMSTAANWEGGLPQAGDDLDFTLAPPLAEIDADISGTYGKLWLDDGDIPTFTGSGTLVVSGCNFRAKVAGNPAITFAAADYTWNGGAAANWSDTGVWIFDNAAADWEDGSIAIFQTANATATLTENITAESLAFTQPATIATNGTDAATLTVSTVSVASGVSATISAPTAGALEKTGTGTLTLTQDRSAATTLAEGTLELSGTASLDWTKFTLGTDAAKPVTLEFGTTAAFSSVPSTWKIGNEANITSTIVKNGGDWTTPTHIVIGNANGASTTFINESGNFTSSGNFRVGDSGSATLVVNGGTAGSTSSSSTQVFVGYTGEGTLVVTNGGVFSANQSLFVARSANGTINVADRGCVHAGADIVFNYNNTDGRGVVNLGRGGVVEANRAYRSNAGSSSFNFDGGTFRRLAAGDFFAANNDAAAIDVTVGANGGTLDNNGFAVRLPRTIIGTGGLTFSGGGKTTVSADQSYLGTTTVSNGTTLSVSGGVVFAGPVVFEAGAALDIANYVGGVTPLAAVSLTFPSEGTMPLTLNGGAFPEGIYAIYSKTGVTAAEGEKFSFTTENGESASWSVADDTLFLTVGNVNPNAWTGIGDGVSMSDSRNWAGRSVPAAGADVDFSGISSAVTINADAGRTFGAVTMGDGVITFTNALTATSFSDHSKVAVGEDSTVTINGDLVFSFQDGNAHVICQNVAAGGVFRVTGRIVADSANTGYIVPCPGSIAGTIAAAGLVNNSSSNDDVFRLVRGSGASSVNWEIGAAGISGTKRFIVSNVSGSSATIKAAANFTVSTTIVQYKTLAFDTAGYTITLGTNTAAKAGGILPASSAGLTTIAGSGTVVANYDVDNLSSGAGSKVGSFTVADGATLALNPGSNLGTGLLTVEDGGTLKVAESGTVTLGGDLALGDGAILAFNWTKRSDAPVLALASGKTMTAGGAVTVKVSATGIERPKGGNHVLTTCGGFDAEGVTVALAAGAPDWVKGFSVNGDGNLVLDVKIKGTVVIFH